MADEDELFEVRQGMVLELGRAMGYERPRILEQIAEHGLLAVWDDYLTIIRSVRVRYGGLADAQVANDAKIRAASPGPRSKGATDGIARGGQAGPPGAKK